MIVEAVSCAVNGHDLSDEQMQGAMRQILSGEATDAQMAALAVALRMKGEAPNEIAAAAKEMRAQASRVSVVGDGPLLDTCGTGGGGAQTFNISTAVAIVVAACGVRVAKHGSRAVSSKVGSSGLLRALGVEIDLSPEQVAGSIAACGIGFLFAPHHHAAMRHAAPVRKQLGLRTFFNQLGPLSNPAGATHQLVGVYDPALTTQFAHALGILGLKRAWVVHGDGGLDEVSPSGPTRLSIWDGKGVETTTLTPEDFGCERASLESLKGGDAATNAIIVRDVFSATPGGPTTAVILNAAAALCAADVEVSLKEAAQRVRSVLQNGSATAKLEEWVSWTQDAVRGA